MGLLDKFFKPRESAADRAAWLQSAVRAAGDRVQSNALQTLRRAERSFETAETPAWTDSWQTHAAGINEDLARQLPTIRARSRGLARNNEWAIRYLIQLDDNVLGEHGIRLQVRLKKPDGSQDTAANTLLESAWEKFCKSADVSGLSFRNVEGLALGTLPRDGELLYRLRPNSGPMGFQIQLIDATLLDTTLHREWGGNRIRMGVEITDEGKAVAYWIRASRVGDEYSDLISVGRHVRIPAEQIRHRFMVEEIGQLRGIPWLSAGARRLWLLHDFEESAAVASNNAAKRQGFFVSPNGDAPPGFSDTIISSVLEAAKAAGKVLTPDEIKSITDAAEKYSTTVPGQYDTLPQGYDFRPYESVWPNINADTYVKQQIRGWSAARGMSYVTIGNDLEAVNYSSAQVGIIGERDHYKTIQSKLKEWLHCEVFAAALPYLILATPGLKMSRQAEYLAAVTWQPRRWQALDPLKTAKSNETNLLLKLTSRRRIILERGDDPDEIDAEIAEEEKRYGPIQPTGIALPPEGADGDEGSDSADAADNKKPATKFLA